MAEATDVPWPASLVIQAGAPAVIGKASVNDANFRKPQDGHEMRGRECGHPWLWSDFMAPKKTGRKTHVPSTGAANKSNPNRGTVQPSGNKAAAQSTSRDDARLPKNARRAQGTHMANRPASPVRTRNTGPAETTAHRRGGLPGPGQIFTLGNLYTVALGVTGLWNYGKAVPASVVSKVYLPAAPDGVHAQDTTWNSLPVSRITNCEDYTFNKHSGGTPKALFSHFDRNKSVVDGMEDHALKAGMVRPTIDQDGQLSCPPAMHMAYYAIKISPLGEDALRAGKKAYSTEQLFQLAYESFIDPPDYHWLRQNEDGTWTHKPGYNNDVTDKDGSGNVIIWPHEADLNLKLGGFFPFTTVEANYSLPGKYLCAPDLSATSSEKAKT